MGSHGVGQWPQAHYYVGVSIMGGVQWAAKAPLPIDLEAVRNIAPLGTQLLPLRLAGPPTLMPLPYHHRRRSRCF